MSKWQDAGFPDHIYFADPLRVLNALYEACVERWTGYLDKPETLLPKDNPIDFCAAIDRSIRTMLSVTLGDRLWVLHGNLWYFSNGGYDYPGSCKTFKALSDLFGVPYIPPVPDNEDYNIGGVAPDDFFLFFPRYSVDWAYARYVIINSMCGVSPSHSFHNVSTETTVSDEKVNTKIINNNHSDFYNYYEKTYYSGEGYFSRICTRMEIERLETDWDIKTPVDISFHYVVPEYKDMLGVYHDFGSGIQEGEVIPFMLKNVLPGESRTVFPDGFFSIPKEKPQRDIPFMQYWEIQESKQSVNNSPLYGYEHIRVLGDMRPYLEYYDPPEKT